ncbi:MAG: Asp-tRNA(Asn)/Glu-tRNA(Gln) amidotransferase subunit GatC [Oscillospiraceae bacterium]
MSEMNIDIRHIAKLARLEIADDELSQFEEQMKNIVNMVENLPDISDELKPDPNTPMILRKDVAETDKFTRAELMQNAPSVKAGCLVVPKTVE